MNKLINEDKWVWVFIQDPGGNEQFLGQHDEDKNISFIPTFVEKEQAQECLNFLVREKDQKYEVQAIHYDDLIHRSAENGFMIFILNGQGEVIDKIKP
jgi:hypothetical protein